MFLTKKSVLAFALASACWTISLAQQAPSGLPANCKTVGDSARPWVFWYWMHGAYSKPAIKADLQAMKDAGIIGAYLAPIKGKTDPPIYTPAIDQLSPEWWDMVKYAVKTADSLNLKIALLPNDGFATAGGPWIKPEQSMQKVVYTTTPLKGGTLFTDTLTRPESYKGYYEDIAVLAFPSPTRINQNSYIQRPKVTSSTGADASFLAEKGNKKTFGSTDPCWIQYEFDRPFTCRSVVIHVNSFNFQSQRLLIETSNDGVNFKVAEQLSPARSGWLDWDFDNTHEIKPVTAKYFRFKYNREGTEPGAEDIDAAKWKQSLKIAGIELSSQPRINHLEGKSAEVYRIAPRTTREQVADSLCVPLAKIIDLTSRFSNNKLNWKAPKGDWIILRIGHTSTGHMNETAGAGKGLESDKFNPAVTKIQFDKWFGEAMRTVGPELAPRVLNTFHVDSWESGSQNWSPVFREEFKKRRGYDLLKYLPAMAGIPVENVNTSERFLTDVRETISELITDNFFDTLRDLCKQKGVIFTAETTGPVMVADGMLHYKHVDVPMGEFWLRSPSHDKPNDMLDAISAAHIYGKPVVAAESFTEIRMDWREHPGNLKTLQDRNYALGINRFVYHVFAQNPWPDRKPGMTLNDIGLLFQRDQTWWKPGYAWVEYARRCQTILQNGVPVTDIAVFTGEESPRRAILPDRLVQTLPGIFGPERVAAERQRLANAGSPTVQMPDAVHISANIATADKWTDPLNGYAYDSFNKDALIRLATVKDGRIVLPGGASYAMLVLPEHRKMTPTGDVMSLEVAQKLLALVNDGATVLLGQRPIAIPGLSDAVNADKKVQDIAAQLWGGSFAAVQSGAQRFMMKQVGKGRVIQGPFEASSFDALGLQKDLLFPSDKGTVAWTHRRDTDKDIYFISNQDSVAKQMDLSFRVNHAAAEVYDAVSGERWQMAPEHKGGRSSLSLKFPPNGSLFVIFHSNEVANTVKDAQAEPVVAFDLTGPWSVSFDHTLGGPSGSVKFETLSDWTTNADTTIKYYSGTARYEKSFKNTAKLSGKRVWLDLGEVANIAAVKLNGKDCGVAWTAPYRVEITDALKKGTNKLEVEVTNTWANRILGDLRVPEDKRVVKTTAVIRIAGKPLAKAGLLGTVKVLAK